MARRSDWKRAIWKRDRWLCYYCGCNVSARDPHRTDAATVDHKLPLARGGTGSKENLVTACRGCNAGKGDMTVAEYERAGKPREEYAHRSKSVGASLKAGVRLWPV